MFCLVGRRQSREFWKCNNQKCHSVGRRSKPIPGDTQKSTRKISRIYIGCFYGENWAAPAQWVLMKWLQAAVTFSVCPGEVGEQNQKLRCKKQTTVMKKNLFCERMSSFSSFSASKLLFFFLPFFLVFFSPGLDDQDSDQRTGPASLQVTESSSHQSSVMMILFMTLAQMFKQIQTLLLKWKQKLWGVILWVLSGACELQRRSSRWSV